jgi:Na+/melibiose symporter-like transporter
VEIILKPIIAHISDNSTFKTGRRKPFMLLGCGFYALFLILIFSPLENLSKLGISLWFGLFYVLFFCADTITNIPYLALGPELSNDTKEREKLYIYFYTSQYIGVLVSSMAPEIIKNIVRNCNCNYCDEIINPMEKSKCISTCESTCELTALKTSLQIIAVFIGLLFVFTIILLSNRIKEKKQEKKNENEGHFIPTLFRLYNNKPFLRLLIPWIIDVTITQIFATMLPFFITYITNPFNYCKKNKIDLTNENCTSNFWLAITISVFFFICILSMFLWDVVVKYVPRKTAWQSYSLFSVFSFALFLICGEGTMAILVIFSIINAIPAGGAYLNDVFTSDIIDYDEFTTGKRNEGIYIVFSSFTPKIVTIFAQSLPLTFMSGKEII